MDPAPTTELVIFDCDGTLVDSEPIAARIDSEVLTELGWAMTPEKVMRRFVGRSHAHFVEVVSERLGIDLERWHCHAKPEVAGSDRLPGMWSMKVVS